MPDTPTRHPHVASRLLLALTLLASAPTIGLSQQSFIEKLDGSRLGFSEVDELVSALMREAHVTGMGCVPSSVEKFWRSLC